MTYLPYIITRMTHSLHLVILRQEAARHKIPERVLLSRMRTAAVARVRHIVWNRMNKELSIRPSKIAVIWGVSHTSVGYALAKIDGHEKYGA